MNRYLRMTAVVALFILALGLVGFLWFLVSDGFRQLPDLRDVSGHDGGMIAAVFLAIREIISKIENIVLGIHLSPAVAAEILEDRA